MITPQEVALLDSQKAVDFARTVKTWVTEIIENMSGLSGVVIKEFFLGSVR